MEAILNYQNMPSITHSNPVRKVNLADKVAIKRLLDEFSEFTNTKNVKEQRKLFLENATWDWYYDEVLTSELIGQKKIAKALKSQLYQNDNIYHVNGQQYIDVEFDKATSISNSLIVITNQSKNKLPKAVFRIQYNDSFLKRKGQWYFESRIVNYIWRQSE